MARGVWALFERQPGRIYYGTAYQIDIYIPGKIHVKLINLGICLLVNGGFFPRRTQSTVGLCFGFRHGLNR